MHKVHDPRCMCLGCYPSRAEWDAELDRLLGPLPEAPTTTWVPTQRTAYVKALSQLPLNAWVRMLGDPDAELCMIAAGDPDLIAEVCRARRR